MTRREKTQDTDNCVQLQQKGSGETKVHFLFSLQHNHPVSEGSVIY